MNYLWVLKITNQLINKFTELNECVNDRASPRHSRECVNLARDFRLIWFQSLILA